MAGELHIGNDQFQYIARISHGKDSLKMLDVIVSRGLRLDRITTTLRQTAIPCTTMIGASNLKTNTSSYRETPASSGRCWTAISNTDFFERMVL